MGSQRVYIILRVKLGHIPSYSTCPPPSFFLFPLARAAKGMTVPFGDEFCVSDRRTSVGETE